VGPKSDLRNLGLGPPTSKWPRALGQDGASKPASSLTLKRPKPSQAKLRAVWAEARLPPVPPGPRSLALPAVFPLFIPSRGEQASLSPHIL
jgi:hypothetical protein